MVYSIGLVTVSTWEMFRAMKKFIKDAPSEVTLHHDEESFENAIAD